METFSSLYFSIKLSFFVVPQISFSFKKPFQPKNAFLVKILIFQSKTFLAPLIVRYWKIFFLLFYSSIASRIVLLLEAIKVDIIIKHVDCVHLHGFVIDKNFTGNLLYYSYFNIKRITSSSFNVRIITRSHNFLKSGSQKKVWKALVRRILRTLTFELTVGVDGRSETFLKSFIGFKAWEDFSIDFFFREQTIRAMISVSMMTTQPPATTVRVKSQAEKKIYHVLTRCDTNHAFAIYCTKKILRLSFFYT